MDITNQEKIGRALGNLRTALVPLIDSGLRQEDKANWRLDRSRGAAWDSSALDVKDCLEILNKFWDRAFSSPRMGRAERAWVNELCIVRNKHAHPTSTDEFSTEFTWRALDTVERLLNAIRSPEAQAVRLLRVSLYERPPAQKAPAVSVPPPRITLGPDPPFQRTSFPESMYLPNLLGGITIGGSSAKGLRSVTFGKTANADRTGPLVLKAASQLEEYLQGKRAYFDLPLDLHGTSFQLKVWSALSAIPYGQRRSYRDIAVAVDNPKGAQAVGQANGSNPLLIVIPCHRVIAADGSLGGWGPGPELKRRLLDLEQRNAHRFR